MTDATSRSARQWALKTLARRMHTAQEIERGLAERGWPSCTVERIVDDLKERGYIDDAKFAEMWVASRSERRLHGRFRLLRDLLAKGVEEGIATAVIQDLLPREREVAIARKAAEKRARTLKVSGIRAAAALQRHLRSKGFNAQVIQAVLSDFPVKEDPS